MTGTGIKPRDVPAARQDILTWIASPGAFQALAPRGQTQYARALHASLRAAELYYVNADMTALARTVGEGLDVYGLSDDDIPARHGFLVWESPATDHDAHYAPVAVSWMSSGSSISFTLFVARDAYTAWARTCGPGYEESAHLLSTGRLVLRGNSGTLPIGGEDRGWGALRLGDQEQLVRSLLATWILIRQPADDRRALHQVEEVPVPRAVQKRIRREGGNPDQAVRLVTLRQSLQRPVGEVDPGGDRAARIYRHRWIVRAHRANQFYPSRGEHRRIWRGPYLVVPKGCEAAQILGGERVNVLRR